MLMLSLALATPPDLVTSTLRWMCTPDGLLLIDEQRANRGTHYDDERTLNLHRVPVHGPVESMRLGGWNVNTAFPSVEAWSTGADASPWLADASECIERSESGLRLDPEGWMTLGEHSQPLEFHGLDQPANVLRTVDHAGVMWVLVHGELPAGGNGDRLVRVEPDMWNHALARLHNDAAMAAYAVQDLEGARRHLHRALEADPGYDRARYNLACVFALTGRPDAAMRELHALTGGRWLDRRLATDPDLDALRGRDDFDTLQTKD